MPTLVEDWKWVALTVAQESSSEPFEGKVAVAEVIRNRTKTLFFSKGTVGSTILWPYQFSGWNTSDPNRSRVVSYDIGGAVMIDCIHAYTEAFERNSNVVGNANLYHAKTLALYPEWTKSDRVKLVKTVGNHIFYYEER